MEAFFVYAGSVVVPAGWRPTWLVMAGTALCVASSAWSSVTSSYWQTLCSQGVMFGVGSSLM